MAKMTIGQFVLGAAEGVAKRTSPQATAIVKSGGGSMSMGDIAKSLIPTLVGGAVGYYLTRRPMRGIVKQNPHPVLGVLGGMAVGCAGAKFYQDRDVKEAAAVLVPTVAGVALSLKFGKNQKYRRGDVQLRPAAGFVLGNVGTALALSAVGVKSPF